MNTTREKYNQRSLLNELADEHCHVETVEKLIGDIDFGFAEISNIKTVQSEKTVHLPERSRTGIFYYTLYDIELEHHPCQVVRVSEKVKTTAFTNNFSFN